MRLSRRQLEVAREIESARSVDPHLPAPTVETVGELLAKARSILRRDGGDLELVALENDTVTVRMSGSCASCPRSALDVKHIVERLVRERFPQLKVERLGASLPTPISPRTPPCASP
jgi:toxin CptA